MGNMRSDAEVDHVTATIDSGRSALWNLFLDEVNLVLVILEHFKENLLWEDESFEFLLFLNHAFRK